ncbi:MAG: hypothetical protein HN348_14970, partial [Proteobacteria bacterium]|nr:hypothetical protein [Pseudomonadota bacterium]
MTITTLLFFAAATFAADEPCYGHQWENRLEGEHFWVEWEEGVIGEPHAELLLEAVESARVTYVEEMGWPAPDPSIVVSVKIGLFGAAGACLTQTCDSGPLPLIEVYDVAYAAASPHSTATHEFGHAVQYTYMGSMTESLASWAWWMEGTAMWLQIHSDYEGRSWKWDANQYMANPQLALHHDALYLLDETTGPHMYGTMVLALYIEGRFGEDGVRQTWETGAAYSG